MTPGSSPARRTRRKAPRLGRGPRSIYATLSSGYDAVPIVLGAVDTAAGAGIDLRPWLTSIGALDESGAPNESMRRGSTFVSALIIAKLFVPIKVPITAALTPTVAKYLQRYMYR